MGGEAVNHIAKATSAGIPVLFEWGGLVTLLTLLLIAAGFAIAGMYWQNQKMFKETIEATNRGAQAIEKLTEWVKGSKS